MAEDTPTLNLKILSPSAEVEGGVTFSDIPATTSVRELRSRIQDAVPSKPAPDRMRLIYRGRVVANDNDTLTTVFGVDNIRESKDQSLHLVLRELPPTSSTSSSPGPRAAAQPPATASPPLQTNPFRTLPQPRPSSQPPQVPQPHHPHHPHHHPHVHHHHIQGNPNAFAIPLPPAIQQQLAQTMAAAQAEQMNNARIPSPAAAAAGANPPTAQAPPAPQVGAQAPVMGLPPLPGMGQPNDGRTVRQEGVGPNGERWSVTYSSTTIPNQAPILPRPLMQPPVLGQPPRPAGSPAPAEATEFLLPRMRVILQSARQEMDNVRTLLQASGQQMNQPLQFSSMTPPPWRLERIRQHVQTMGQNLNLAERVLGVIAADTSARNNPDVLAMRQSTNELRGHLEELNRMMGQQGGNASSQMPSSDGTASILPSGASSTATILPTSQATPHTTSTIPPNAPEELFLLSSPQGPVGILFDQRGTYMTAPMAPTLPFQTFTNQFAQNRQLIAGLGQHMMQNARTTASPATHTNNVLPTPTQPAGTDHAHGQHQAADQGQGGDQNQEQQAVNVNVPANAQGENDRAGNMAGHLWLVFKLACFVYFFSGTGWYKSLLLGLIAGGVYLAQIGMFEEQFNLIRRHFEAVLPVGALADQPAQPGAAEPRRNMTPEEAARRLLQQHQNQRFGWVRESMRTVERSFAIFVASLWPGIGERMVHAQEERVRVERAAEEERVRLEEEERKKREEEAQQQQSDEKNHIDAVEGSTSDPGATTSSVKGKERAETVDPEPATA